MYRIVEVFYSTAGTQGNREILVLAQEETISDGLAARDPRFKIGDRHSKINRSFELNRNRVKMAELSVADFVKLTESAVKN